MPEIEGAFGAVLRRCRETHDLTREQLAERVGCAVETIRKIERDQRRPSKEIAERLALALEIGPDERISFLRHARGRITAVIDAPAGEGVPAPIPTAAFQLPIPLTPLFGRSSDVEAVSRLLFRADVHVLTLLGPPGIGKTRLGLHVAAAVGDRFADGVKWVALAALTDADLVLATLAREFGLTPTASTLALERLRTYLHHKQILLILDNCEQVLGIAPALVTLLQTAPGVKILATSRTPFHIQGEHQWPVAPLLLPPLDPLPPLPELAAYAAVQLFVSRAEAVRPHFRLTTANAPAIAAICVRLDGLPLALELAAARTKIFAPEALVARLADRFGVLAGQGRDREPRQQTLRGAVDWSYDLLTPAAQRLFAHLAIFVGGFQVSSAAAVHGPIPDLIDELDALVDQSLLQAAPGTDGEPRFKMLETIRVYALERLHASGDEAVVRQRHADYFLALAEQGEPEMARAAVKHWADRLEEEHDNFRFALTWLLQSEQVEQAGRIAAALWQFWESRAHLAGGITWLKAVLARGANLPLPVQADVLNALGRLLHTQGDIPGATQCFEQHLDLRRAIGEPRRIGYALNDLGTLLVMTGATARGVIMLEQALARFREQADHAGIADVLLNLGSILVYGADDFDRARQILQEALWEFEAIGNLRGSMAASGNLGFALLRGGELAAAARMFGRGLGLARQLDDKMACLYSVLALGVHAIEDGRLADGVRLIGAGERARAELGVQSIPVLDVAAALAHAQAQLKPEQFAQVWAAGQAMQLVQIVDFALAQLDDHS